MIKIQIKSIFGNVLFEHECENNTIKETLKEAIKNGSNLRGSNLRGSDLSGSNLRGSNLSGSDLSGSDLRGSITHLIYCKWSYGMKDNKIIIGCKEKTIEEWNTFFESKEEFETKRETEDFKRIYATFKAMEAFILAMK